MKIKNVSGSTKSFSFGKVYSGALLNNGTATFPDGDPDALAQVAALAKAGTIDILVGPALGDLVPYNDYGAHFLLTLGTGVANAGAESSFTCGGVTLTLAASTGVASDDAAALKVAINANATLAALGVIARDIIDSSGDSEAYRATLLVDVSTAKDYTTLAAGTSVATTGAKLTIIKVAASENVQRMVVRKVSDSNIAATKAAVVFTGLRDVQTAWVSVRTAAGNMVAFDGKITISGSLVAIDVDGSVDVGATDVIFVQAFGY